MNFSEGDRVDGLPKKSNLFWKFSQQKCYVSITCANTFLKKSNLNLTVMGQMHIHANTADQLYNL